MSCTQVKQIENEIQACWSFN